MTAADVGAHVPDIDAPGVEPISILRSRAGLAAGRPGWEARYVASLLRTDLVAALVAALAALQLANGVDHHPLYPWLTALLPVAWAGVVALHRGYDPRVLFVGSDEYQRILLAWLNLVAGIAIVSYALNAQIARSYVLVAAPATLLLALGSRLLHRHRLSRAWAAGRCLRRVVVVGHERSVIGMARQLRSERYHGMDVIAACLPADTAARGGSAGGHLPRRVDVIDLPVYGDFDDVAGAAARADADAVIVLASPELDGPALRRLGWHLERLGVELIVASALLDVAGGRTTLRPVDGLPMLHVEHPRLTGGRRVVKDVVDRAGAAALLLLLAPLLLVVAGLIRFDRHGPGPVLFRQTRVGRDGAEFAIVKFRTMYVDAEARLADLHHLNDHDGALFKLREDPRVTRVGRWLRRYSLDELPQLLNVVRGDMSLVGPRPSLPAEVERYPSDMRRRMVVKPGLTGLWQVSGRSDLSWEDAIRLDLRYVENWSLTLDLVILMRTVGAVLRSAGAY
jgi:exopolysaccharide biosynthesis polyprenyl glycosylphosphotransferase